MTDQWRLPATAMAFRPSTRLRYRRGDGSVFLFAFDLLELNSTGQIAKTCKQ
jgi:hypothetical protein